MVKEKVSASTSNQNKSKEINGFVYDLYLSSNGVVDDHIHDQLVRYFCKANKMYY